MHPLQCSMSPSERAIANLNERGGCVLFGNKNAGPLLP